MRSDHVAISFKIPAYASEKGIDKIAKWMEIDMKELEEMLKKCRVKVI